MSEISDLERDVELMQYMLVKAKLQEAAKAIKEGRKLSEEEKDYVFTYKQVEILSKMLEEQGYKEGKDFIRDVITGWYFEEPDKSFFAIRIGGDYIRISNDSYELKLSGERTPVRTNREEIETEIGLEVDLPDIDLEQIQIENPLEKTIPKDKTFEKRIVGLATHKVSVRESENRTAQLVKDASKQLPADQLSLDDE